MKDVTGKYKSMIESFECDFNSARDGDADLSKLNLKDYRISKDIDLLVELSYGLRNGKLKIVENSIYEYAVEIYSNEGFRYQIDVFDNLEKAEEYAKDNSSMLEDDQFIIINEIEYYRNEEVGVRKIKIVK